MPDDKGFIRPIPEVNEYYMGMGGAMAKNVVSQDGASNAISNFRIYQLTDHNGKIFGDLDLKSPAKPGFVYWYPHKRLSDISGFEIHGIKFR